MTQFYFQSYGEFHVLNSDDEYVVQSNMPYNAFDAQEGYVDNEQGLRQYKADFIEWTEQLRKNKVYGVNYTSYNSHTS